MKCATAPGLRAMCVGMCILGIVLYSSISMAASLTWDRNSEPDMKDYAVYACFTPNCVVVKSASTLQPGFVAQPPVGVKPLYVFDLAWKEGSVAVSARDQSLNESGLSVAVPFDQKAPAVPANPALQ